MHAPGGSDVWLPEGGRLTVYAPGATSNLTRCTHSCLSVTAADVAGGVLTTTMLDGRFLAILCGELFPNRLWWRVVVLFALLRAGSANWARRCQLVAAATTAQKGRRPPA